VSGGQLYDCDSSLVLSAHVNNKSPLVAGFC
jgi:hypothetical protein